MRRSAAPRRGILRRGQLYLEVEIVERLGPDRGHPVGHVDHDGGATFQPTLDIVLVGVDLTNSGAFANDEQIIQALINGNQLVV